MRRKNRFVIVLTQEERDAIERLAAQEKMPASTYVRSTLMQEIDKRGLFKMAAQTKQKANKE